MSLCQILNPCISRLVKELKLWQNCSWRLCKFQIFIRVRPQVIISDNLYGVLEMMIMKLTYILFLFFSFFVLRKVELKISFSIYFHRHTCWINSSSFK